MSRATEDDHDVLELIWNVWQYGPRAGLPPSALTDSERALAGELVASHVLAVNDTGDLALAAHVQDAIAPAFPKEMRKSHLRGHRRAATARAR